MFFSKNNKSILFIVIFLGIISLIFAAYIGEDSLGGAKHDFLFHAKYINNFAENFQNAFNDFGKTFEVRNSPVFYIYSSLLVKFGFKIELLKYLNLFIIFPLIVFFLKSINLKHKKLTFLGKSFLIAIIFISPTIRSLSAWPYPLTWAICFFIISIYYFLKFEETKIKKDKFYFALLNIFFLAISAYFTPNFGVFAIYYFINFVKFFKISKQTLLIILSNIILSLPAIYFLALKDFYIFRHETEHVIQNYSIYDTINISNKIIIITSIIFFFFLPLIDFKKIKFKNFYGNNLPLILFIIINIFFYNFSPGLGGGFFFHLSNILVNGPYLLFLIFIISLYIFKDNGLFNINNFFLFFILIIYNIQSTIYFKYYDPIIFFIILFLVEQKKYVSDIVARRYMVFYLFFLFISFGKEMVIN